MKSFGDIYQIPKSCNCGRKPLIMTNVSKGIITAKCRVSENKLVSIKTMKLEPTGKKPCDFNMSIQYCEAPEITLDLDLDNLNIDSKLKKNLKWMINNYVEDRNILIYYTDLFKSQETDPVFVEKCMKKLEKIDIGLLNSMSGKIKALKSFPDYSKIHELIWIVREYINPKAQWKLETVDQIKDFYSDIREIYLNTKKHGFVYEVPFPRKICHPKAKPVIKKVCNEWVEKDPLLIPLRKPNEMNNINVISKKQVVEFSDSEDEDSDNDEEGSDNDENVEKEDEMLSDIESLDGIVHDDDDDDEIKDVNNENETENIESDNESDDSEFSD